jgi:hypothetical protein
MILPHDKSNGGRTKERRKHWRDRRVNADRRSPQRLQRSTYDCRSGIPRRASDLGGELAEGEVWWEVGSEYT